MSVYLIVTKQPDARVRARLEQHYRGHSYYWTDYASFLETADSPIQISDKIGVAVGLNRRAAAETAGETVTEHADPVGQVAILMLAPAYWGHSDAALWEWLKTSFEKAA